MVTEDQYEGGWRRRSIEKSRWYKGKERGLEAYSLIFGLKVKDFEGKRILDLGAGRTAQFQKDIEKANIGSFVVALSPDFIYKDIRERVISGGKSVAAVAALGQNLPFEEASFDMIFAVHVLDHVVQCDILFKMFFEVARVLKPKGKAFFGPVYSFIRAEVARNERLKPDLKGRGIKLYEGRVPEEYGYERVYDYSGMHCGDMLYTTLIFEKTK